MLIGAVRAVVAKQHEPIGKLIRMAASQLSEQAVAASQASEQAVATSQHDEEVVLPSDVKDNLASIAERVRTAAGDRAVRLVAVSKTKGDDLIMACYEQGQRDFGENYAQELADKSKRLPKDIRWHYIGNVQSSKVKLLARIENLAVVETVHSLKIAQELDKVLGRQPACPLPLRVFVQVNTSGEQSKGGVEPDQCVELVQQIRATCPNLVVAGLMTIGDPNATPDQPDFTTLAGLRQRLVDAVPDMPQPVELSMGMSHDFEDAIRFGSTSVRVGTSIFGKRQPKTK